MKCKFNLKKAISRILMITLCGVITIENLYISNVNAVENKLFKNIEPNTWISQVSNIPITAQGLTTVSVDEKIYCMGGLSGDEWSGYTYINKVQIYDTKNNTWSTGTDMPVSKSSFGSVIIDEKIYCIGGYDGKYYYNNVDIYDPKTDTWSTGTDMPNKRSGFGISVIDDKIYCIGGYNGRNYLGTVEVYDPVTDTWETKTSMPTIRCNLVSVAINDKIYCIGGSDATNYYTKGVIYYDIVEIYDPKTDTWTNGSNMFIKKTSLTSVVLDEKIYVLGGEDEMLQALDTVEVYDPKSDSWVTAKKMPTTRRGLHSSVVNGRIYCFGGIDRNYSNVDKVDMYITEYALEIEKENEAEDVVTKAEQTKDPTDIEDAKDLVNQLPESDKKNELLDRLDRLIPKSMTSNIDVYIKPESVLSLSVNTNSVTFEDFDGVEDMEIQNAITLTVESTLPYEINSSLETEIQNSDGTETIDKSILNIRANGESNYNSFSTIKTPVRLLDVQDIDSINNHGIDLRLNRAIIPNIDVYKTTIKFEIKQK